MAGGPHGLPPPVPRTGAECQQTPARTPLLFTLLLRVRVRVHQALFAARVLVFILAPILFLAAALVLLLLLLLRAECLTSARSGALPFPPRCGIIFGHPPMHPMARSSSMPHPSPQHRIPQISFSYLHTKPLTPPASL